MNELPKSYEPAAIEPSWAERWTREPFRADPASGKPPFTIVIPPPNVTGNLHTGHALDNTIIDTLVRYKRMAGFEALFVPGTDHAGISTQVVVERQLRAEGLSRHDLGREAFLERVWAWKEESGGQIIGQLQRIGATCDWTRERFTMDQGLSRAVRRAFVHYYHRGLAYRGERIVNWDPVAQTVLSDLEVDREERPGTMYTLAYPLVDALPEGPAEILIATVRPETIFADVAVAVHPDDERFRDLVGRSVRIPLTDRTVPIIADAAVERDFGVGALKITPAHDQVDFEVGERHGLARPSVIGLDGTLVSELVPAEFRGLDRFEAREPVVAALDASGFLRDQQPYAVGLGISERTKAPVEPLLLEQWFLNVKPLADRVLVSLDAGEMRLVPERWDKVNRDWLENIRDWAIARQLWWGHQIPAWYTPDGEIVVPSLENPDLDPTDDPRWAGVELRRDPDVFDTWFSSALWPFSTLGWPDATLELAKFYPTDVLVTGYDIIFTWVARMQMAGLELMGRAPFSTVVLHGLYLDEKGQKMSKSRGNGVDPLDFVARYGADACRFAWAFLATGGQDIRHDERRYEQGRNFANKLWNASRFAMMNLTSAEPAATGPGAGSHEPTTADRWIRARLDRAILEATAQLDAFDLAGAIRTLYAFTWDEFCDWYIEAAKPSLRAGNTASRETLRQTLAAILRLLHPFMPFVTSEIHQAMAPDASQLAVQEWPRPPGGAPGQEGSERDFEHLRSAIVLTRSLRAELGLPPAQPLEVAIDGEGAPAVRAQLETYRALARAELRDRFEGRSLAGVAPGLEVRVPLEGLVDLEEWRARQHKRIAELRKQVRTSEGKLGSAGFVERAPADVVDEERRRLEDHSAQLERLQTVLEELS